MAKMIEKKKELKDSYTLYWIDYLFEIGSEDLQQNHFEDMNVFQFFDLDIHFFLFTLLFGFLFVAYKFANYCVGYCCMTRKRQIPQEIRTKVD